MKHEQKKLFPHPSPHFDVRVCFSITIHFKANHLVWSIDFDLQRS